MSTHIVRGNVTLDARIQTIVTTDHRTNRKMKLFYVLDDIPNVLERIRPELVLI